jgi:branched-chain amino acid transport system permease protein
MTGFLRNNRTILLTLVFLLGMIAFTFQGLEPKVGMSILLSGITLAALFFLIASGLSLIFGLMDVLNFAHGVIFVLGAFVGLSTLMNPRLLFNTLPFFLSAAGGVAIARHLGTPLWQRVNTERGRKILWWSLLVLAFALLAFGLRRFPIRTLNAFSITTVGGAVPTALAQEPLGLMIQRVAFLFLAGLPFGLAVAPRELRQENRRAALWKSIAITLGLLVSAFAILLLRDPGEQFILGLSVDWRFLLALTAGTLAGMLAGAGIEIVLIRPFYGNPVTQLVLTLGLMIAGTDLIEAVWGEESHPPMEPPSWFNGACRSDSLIAWFSEHCRSIDVLGRAFPTYRLFIIFVGIAIFIGVGILLKRTRLGMIIRAGVQDSEMVQALGINVRQVFTLVFALGSGLAALGGVIAAPFLGVFSGMGQIFILQAFIAVVIGGMGSYTGAAIGTLILGLARAYGDHFVAAGIDLPFLANTIKGSPAIARASTVLIMAIVLLVRPAGIFGKKE